MIPKSFFSIVFLLIVQLAFTQVPEPATTCKDERILRQVDSIKNIMLRDSFTVVRETSMAMESAYEWPIMATLQSDTWYECIFIGDPDSKLLEIRIYDQNEKEVVYKKHYGLINGNIIRFYYRSKFSEWHIIRPVQVHKKKKQLCGYIMLFKKKREA